MSTMVAYEYLAPPGFSPGIIITSSSKRCLARKVQTFGNCILRNIMLRGPWALRIFSIIPVSCIFFYGF